MKYSNYICRLFCLVVVLVNFEYRIADLPVHCVKHDVLQYYILK